MAKGFSFEEALQPQSKGFSFEDALPTKPEPILSPEEQVTSQVGQTSGTTAADLAKLTAAGAVKGTLGAPEAIESGLGATARGSMFAPTDALNYIADPRLLTNKLAGAIGISPIFEEKKLVPEETTAKQKAALDEILTKGKVPVLKTLTEYGNKLSEDIESSISPEMKLALAESQPTGNILKALETGDFSDVSLGKNPTFLGLSGQAAKVFGSAAPAFLTAGFTKSVGPAAAVGFGQAGAEGVDEARNYIGKMSDDELTKKSEYFRNLVALGYSPKDAREMTIVKAGDTAALYQGTVGALGGAFTNKLLQGAFDKTLLASAKSRLAKIAQGTAVGATEGGLSEMAEGIATDLGIDKSVVREIGVDSFANLVLGALGEGAPGTVRGAIARTEAETPPAVKAEVAQQPVAPVEVTPAITPEPVVAAPVEAAPSRVMPGAIQETDIEPVTPEVTPTPVTAVTPPVEAAPVTPQAQPTFDEWRSQQGLMFGSKEEYQAALPQLQAQYQAEMAGAPVVEAVQPKVAEVVQEPVQALTIPVVDDKKKPTGMTDVIDPKSLYVDSGEVFAKGQNWGFSLDDLKRDLPASPEKDAILAKADQLLDDFYKTVPGLKQPSKPQMYLRSRSSAKNIPSLGTEAILDSTNPEVIKNVDEILKDYKVESGQSQEGNYLHAVDRDLMDKEEDIKSPPMTKNSVVPTASIQVAPYKGGYLASSSYNWKGGGYSTPISVFNTLYPTRQEAIDAEAKEIRKRAQEEKNPIALKWLETISPSTKEGQVEINKARQAEKKAKAAEPKAEKPAKKVEAEAAPNEEKLVDAIQSMAYKNNTSTKNTANDFIAKFGRKMFDDAVKADLLDNEPGEGRLFPSNNYAYKVVSKYYDAKGKKIKAEKPTKVEKLKEVHVEGKKEEPVTSKTIEESFDKAVTKVDSKKIKSAIKNQFDQAIKRSEILTEEEFNKAKLPDSKKFVTIDVPGDGKFKVKNNKENLEKLQKRLMGATSLKAGTAKRDTLTALNASSPAVVMKGMLADGELENALEYGKLNKLDPYTIGMSPIEMKNLEKAFGGERGRLEYMAEIEGKPVEKVETYKESMDRINAKMKAEGRESEYTKAARELAATKAKIKELEAKKAAEKVVVPETKSFDNWFKGSKVVNEDGSPMVMYHGTNKSQEGQAFTIFDAYGSKYGLFGQGAYFTDNPDIASQYTKKGKGETPTVYPVYLSIKNPIDMDAKADPAQWEKAFPDINFSKEGFPPNITNKEGVRRISDTNEGYYRAVEEFMEYEQLPHWEASESIQGGLMSMGYDGITHIGGGRVGDGVKHRVYIAFEPEQAKFALEAKNEKPYTVKEREDAEHHARDVGGEVAYQKGNLALVRGYSALTGAPTYAVAKGTQRSKVEVGSYTGNLITSAEKAELVKVVEQLEKDAQKKHKEAPYIKFKNGIALSEDIPADLGGVIKEWKNLLGLKSDIYVSTIQDAKENKSNFTGPHRVIGSGTLSDTEAGSMRRMPDNSYYVLFEKTSSKTKMLEVIAHELGHVHEREVYSGASPEIKKAINDEFQKWVLSQKGNTAQQLVNSLRAKTTAKTANVPAGAKAEDLSPYWTSFKEWYADQVSRWATTTETPLTVVEKFFKRLGNQMRRFYSNLKNKGYLPNETFKQYLDSLVDSKDPISDVGEDADFAPEAMAKKIIPRADAIDKLLEKYDRADTPLHPSGEVKDAILGSYQKSKKIATKMSKNPLMTAVNMVGKADRAITYARNKNIWFGSGLDQADFARYNGKLKDSQGIAVASVAVTNAIHAGHVGTQVMIQGGLEFDFNEETGKGTQMFRAVKKDYSMANVVRLKHDLEEKLGAQRAANVVNAYFEAKRSRSIIEEFLKREGEYVKALESGEAEEDAAKNMRNIEVARQKVNMDDEQIDDFIALENDYPELRKMMDNWTKVNHDMLDQMAFAGVISKKRATQLKAIEDYVPWYRIMDDQTDIHQAVGVRGMTNVGQEKRFKEGEVDRDIDDIVDNMIHNVMMMTRNTMKNWAANQVAIAYATRKPDTGKIKLYPAEGSDANGVRTNIIMNGRRVVVNFPDPLVAEAVLGMENIEIPMIDILAFFANGLRRGITTFPVFQVSQLFMDAPTAALVSGVKKPFALMGSTFGGFIQALKPQDDIVDLLKSYGIGGYQSSARTPEKELKLEIGLLDKSVWAKAMKTLDHIGDASDYAQRRAIYKQVLAETGDEMQALIQANNVIDFLKRGSGKGAQFVTRTVSFMNAYAQSIDVLATALAGGGLKGKDRKAAFNQLRKTGLLLAGTTILYCMAAGADDEYDKLDDQTKLRNIIIPGTKIRLPMHTSASFFFKAIPELIYNKVMKQGTNNKMDNTRLRKALGEAAIDSLLSPNLTPTGIKPIAEIALNHNFFTGGTVTPKGMEKLESFRQYTSATSEMGKVISALTMGALNPIEADHIVRGLFGTAGAAVMYGSNLFSGDRVDPQAKDNPLYGSFILPEVPRGREDLFYDLKERSDKKYETFVDLMKKQHPKEGQQFREENKGLINAHGFVTQADADLKRINAEIRRLSDLPESKMSSAEKRAKITKFQETKNNILEQTIKFRLKAGL